MLSIMLTSAAMCLFFIFLNHPLTFGVILLLETILVSIMSGMMNINFWYSYILFLVMVGGMLILFMYMTSVASNEKFKFSFKMIFPLMLMTMLTISLMTIDPMTSQTKKMNYELTMNILKNNTSLSKYLNFPNSMLMILIISYLLMALIVVVKITKIQYGPLRQKF